MNREPLVTVGIPTYRRPGYLREALRSVLSQSYRNLQVIVADNASGDETAEVVREMADPRVQYALAAQGLPPVENINRCFQLARGKYVMVVCDDDLLSGNYVESMVALMENTPLTMAYGLDAAVDEQGRVLVRKRIDRTTRLDGRAFLQVWLDGELPIGTPLSLFAHADRVRALGGFPLFPSGAHVDNALMMALALQGDVALAADCHYYYRRHAASDSATTSYQPRLASIRAFLEYLDAEPVRPYWHALPAGERALLRRKLLEMFAHEYSSHLFPFQSQLGWRRTMKAASEFPWNASNLRILGTYVVRAFRSAVKRRLVSLRQTFA